MDRSNDSLAALPHRGGIAAVAFLFVKVKISLIFPTRLSIFSLVFFRIFFVELCITMC
jgi:hypothetical protein